MRALIFDLETTGLVTNRTIKAERLPEVIDFAGIVMDYYTGERLLEYKTLVRPKLGLPEKITQITKITQEDLANAPLFEEVAGRIKELIEEAEVVIAHNASFDVEMIDIEFARMGLSVAWPRVLCTVEQSLPLTGFRLKLENLYKLLFGEYPKGEAHRAMADADTLALCCAELVRRDVL